MNYIYTVCLITMVICSCNSQLHKEATQDYGKDVVYAEDGNFGETKEAKEKRGKRDKGLIASKLSKEEKIQQSLSYIQTDLELLGYEVGNTEGILDDQTILAINSFKSKYSTNNQTLINKELEDKVHAEAWEIRKHKLVDNRLELNKKSEARLLVYCLDALNTMSDHQLSELKVAPQRNDKALVYIYRAVDKNNTYPTTRVFINDKKIDRFREGSYTHLYLDPGNYFFEERKGFSLDWSRQDTSRATTMELDSNKTYYLHLSVSHAATVYPVYMGFFVEGIFIDFNSDFSEDKYASKFISEGRDLAECIMKQGNYFEAKLK